MIRKIKSEEIPICVEVIKKSFLTVADEYGFTEENAPRFTAFATTQDRLYWHMDGEHRPMYIFEEEWFTPNIAKEKITVPDIKKRVCDMLEFDGKQHFSTFENIDSKIKFISDILVK